MTEDRLRRPLIVVGAIVALVGLATTGVHFLRSGNDASRRANTEAPKVTAGLVSPQPSDGLGQLEQKVRKNSDDWKSLAALSRAYVQRGRVTGDPTFYPLADKAVQRSLQINPQGNLPAMISESSLSAARHNFNQALDWAQRADAIAPDTPDVKAVQGDALIELGRYPEAFDTFQRMVDLRPSLTAYTRVSYAQELQGNVDGAIQSMQAAGEAASNRSDQAFTEFQLAELYWNSGKTDEAITHYRRSAQLDPSYLPPAAALARASFFTGRPQDAIKQYADVTQRNPFPQYVGDYSDVAALTGKNDLAKQQLAVLDAQDRLFKANGVNVDVELALFNADHGIDLPGSLTAAQNEWSKRKSVVVADSLAWALHANGRDQEALDYANQALHLGSRNALYFYHRARIQEALHNPGAAKADLGQALAINPNFSVLHSQDARQWATQLGLP